MADPKDRTEMDDDCWTDNDQRVSDKLREWDDDKASLQDTVAVIKENDVDDGLKNKR